MIGSSNMKKLALLLALTSGAANASNEIEYYLHNPQFMDYVSCKFSQYMTTEDARERAGYQSEIEKAAAKITTRNGLSKELADNATMFAMGYARGSIDSLAYTAKITPYEAAVALAAELCPEVE